MSGSPGDRFRRIVKAWREQKQGKQRPAPMYAPAKPHRVAQPPRQVADQPVQLPDRPMQPTLPTAAAVARAEAERASRPSQGPGDGVEKPVGARPTVPKVQWPTRAGQETLAPPSADMPALEPGPNLDKLKTPADARHFLERLRAKTNQVVQDFSAGVINQRQFDAIYSHYQRQRITIEKALVEMPGSGAWRAAAIEGHTSFLRQQHAAKVLGYAIYETASGTLVTRVGDFDVDDTSLAPMLSSFRSSTHELFGAGMQQTGVESGRWLCGVPGHYTTLVVLFSAEPAAVQLQMIEDLHRDFEIVNEISLSRGDISQLAFIFTHLWSFEQGPLES